jgi:hypothetical protein
MVQRNSYNTDRKFFNKFIDVEDCVKIPNNSKRNINNISDKKLFLRKKDSIHSHKNMRKQNKDWKDFNQMWY